MYQRRCQGAQRYFEPVTPRPMAPARPASASGTEGQRQPLLLRSGLMRLMSAMMTTTFGSLFSFWQKFDPSNRFGFESF